MADLLATPPPDDDATEAEKDAFEAAINAVTGVAAKLEYAIGLFRGMARKLGVDTVLQAFDVSVLGSDFHHQPEQLEHKAKFRAARHTSDPHDDEKRWNEMLALFGLVLATADWDTVKDRLTLLHRHSSPYHPYLAVCDPTRQHVSEEHRNVVRDVTYDLYHRVCEAIDEHQHTLIAYDGKDMELVKKGGPLLNMDQEDIRALIDAVTSELKVNHMNLGRCTWRRPSLEVGIEADLSLFFDRVKLDQAHMAFRSHRDDEPDVADERYPLPDVAVEVNRFEPLIDRRKIYAKLQVAETWWMEGDVITIERLGENGTYKRVPRSRFLPITVDDLRRAIDDDSDDDLMRGERFAKRAKEIAGR
jgi:hypothetical protein